MIVHCSCLQVYEVPDAAICKGFPCPQCGARIGGNQTASGDAGYGTERAEQLALRSLWCGISSLLCGPFAAAFAFNFGLKVVGMTGLDPVRHAAAKKRAILGIGLAAVLVVLWLVLFLIGVAAIDQEKKEVVSADAASTVSAEALFAEYQANEVKADEKYKGKTFIVEGVVSQIRHTVVELSTSNSRMSVHAGMAASEASAVAGLATGQRVKLKGKGGGMILGSLILKECAFVK